MTPTVAFWVGTAAGVAGSWALFIIATFVITAAMRAATAAEDRIPEIDWDIELADLREGEM